MSGQQKEQFRTDDARQVGPYRLTKRLGAGGMGEVFLGNSRAGRTVVVKLVRTELAENPDFRRRFAMEVAAARKVGGFYTAQVVDADTETARPWLATAYVPGPTLHEAVEQHGPLPEDAVRVLGAGLAEGLTAIHACGIVHRDLTPRNVILAADGPRVIDFGIARALDGSHHPVSAIIGTPGYMSPEQARGDQAGAASDVFSLGSVLTYAASGHGPFGSGPAHAVAYRVVHEEPGLSGVPSGLAAVIRACLSKDPAHRPGLPRILDQFAPQDRPDTGWLPSTVTLMIPDGGPGSTGRVDPAGTLSQGGERRLSRRGLLVAALSAGTAVAAGSVAIALIPPSRPSPAASSPRRRAIQPGPPAILSSGGSSGILALAFSPDGRLLASTTADGKGVRVWDVIKRSPGKVYRHIPVNPFSRPLSEVISYNRSFASPVAVKFSPDGKKLAVANGDGTASVWGIAAGDETVLPYPDPVQWNTSVNLVGFHPDGGTLARTYDSPSVTLWDISAQRATATIDTGGTDWAEGGLIFSPAGDVLVTATGDGNPGAADTNGVIQFWDTSSYARIASIPGANVISYGLTASPDWKNLAALGVYGAVTLWDIATRARKATFTGDRSGVTCIGLGPDDFLAGGYDDGTITLWDTASGNSITSLSTDGNSTLNCVAISPDGKTVASGGSDLTIWELQ